MRMMRWSKATEENVEKRVRDGDGGKEGGGEGDNDKKRANFKRNGYYFQQ